MCNHKGTRLTRIVRNINNRRWYKHTTCLRCEQVLSRKKLSYKPKVTGWKQTFLVNS